MISEYPNFTKIRLAHKNQVEAVTKRFDPYSDFNFTSLICWNADDKTELALLDGNLVICLSDYITGEVVYSILGDTNIEASIDRLISDGRTIKLLPEIVASKITANPKYLVVEDRDQHDYILDVERLATLSSGEFKKKRNKSNSFWASVGDSLVVNNVRSITLAEAARLKVLFNSWADDSLQDKAELENERKAIEKVLAYLTILNLSLTEFYHKGQLVGFSINQVMGDGYAVCHFEKAVLIHDDIYTAMAQEVAKNLLDEGCRFVNWEQDLGLEGMRRSKLSYHPVRLLKKYTLTAS